MSDDDTTPKAAPKPRARKTSTTGAAKSAVKSTAAKASAAKKTVAKKATVARKAASDAAKKGGWKKKAAIGVGAGVGSAAVAAAVLYATKLKKGEQPSPVDVSKREPEES